MINKIIQHKTRVRQNCSNIYQILLGSNLKHNYEYILLDQNLTKFTSLCTFATNNTGNRFSDRRTADNWRLIFLWFNLYVCWHIVHQRKDKTPDECCCFLTPDVLGVTVLCTEISCFLTHWGRDKMDAISQTSFSNAFSWMKMFEYRLKFHWSLFLRVQLTISQHWFR